MRFSWSRHVQVVVACLMLSSVAGARGDPGPRADPDPPPQAHHAEAWSALPEALSLVRTAFLSNDAARLARLFSLHAPVYVAVPPIADGCLAPGPLRAFLDRLVRDRVSTAFELPAGVPPGSGEEPASAFIKVKWTHRAAASDTLQVEYLHLALRYAAEDSEWQIVEMRTSMR